jgi:hypothetical protein
MTDPRPLLEVHASAPLQLFEADSRTTAEAASGAGARQGCSCLSHPDSYVRNEAKKAIRRIDRAAANAAKDGKNIKHDKRD